MRRYALQKENGFTLPEMLIIISILSILLLVITPLNAHRLQMQKEEHFLQILQSDLLYTQTLATANPGNVVRLTIRAEEHVYTVFNGLFPVVERSIPDNWINANHEIVFYQSGIVRQPASFLITTPNQTYKLVFPFGKGRARIDKV